ncbi:ArnT family glycosyltransferase [Brumimicrobium mesophilum]|uniref:ArnT family glycosyltransferase n=1 Tax=Brumimicrobium mesophilum TaxID=392717 RepID=UPI00131ECCC3|nr:glycosyltransferase family 39 protein [Brumimicrobium mesophilum]
MNAIYLRHLKYIVLAVLIFFPLFGHLGSLPIRIWDEGRNAINALEMLKNGNFIVTHYDGTPDMWNTKPPLLIWLQVISMKLFGINETAIRLPSAFAGLFTCIGLLVFSLKYLKSFWFGFITVFVLITTFGYIDFHATRTGDYDALLTLFTTLSGLLFYSFCETKNDKQLYLFFLFTALAVLTKSITGMLFLPALLIYSLAKKQFLPLLKNKHFYFGLISFLILVVGYYSLREADNPGFIAAVQGNELGGRFLEVIEDHEHGFWFYLDNFINKHLSYWHLLIPCGVIFGFLVKDKKINRLTLFSTLMVVTFFLIISTAQTKIEWYSVPMYPFSAILIAVFIYYIFNVLKNTTVFNETLWYNITPFIFLFLLGVTPYQQVFEKTYLPKEHRFEVEFYELGHYLQDAARGRIDINNTFVLYDGYNAHNLFYIKILNDKGIKTEFKDWKNLDSGDKVIAQQKHLKEYLIKHYKYEIIFQKGNVVTYKIYGNKE